MYTVYVGVRAVFNVTLGNELAAQVFWESLVIAIQLQQFQVGIGGIHFFPSLVVDTEEQTALPAIAAVVFQTCTAYGKNRFRIVFGHVLRIVVVFFSLQQFESSGLNDTVGH